MLLLAGSAAPAATLGHSDVAMVANVDATNAQSLALLEVLVNQNSGSNNIDGVTKVGVIMAAELGKLGFETVWKPLPQTG
ncbi:MAG: M20 family peptidase, partial [Polymorphobacter sp.]